MWGAGTALGELPPYFMARAARLSGEEPDDEDLKEFLEWQKMSAAASGDVAKDRSCKQKFTLPPYLGKGVNNHRPQHTTYVSLKNFYLKLPLINPFIG